MNELNHGAGKGDKDRSPGWRKNYDEIRWPGVTGFKRRDSRLRKIYGTPKQNYENQNSLQASPQP